MKTSFNRAPACVQNSSLLISCVFTILCGFSPSAYAASKPLQIEERWSVPMLEVSGLAISGDRLFMISDDEHDLLSGALGRDAQGHFQTETMSRLQVGLKIPSWQQAQWEALAIDQGGGVFLLHESDNTIYQFTSAGKELTRFNLKTWEGRKNPDRGLEGMMLMRNSHFLIALETEPSALIEYGPEGDQPIGLSEDASNFLAPGEVFIPPSTQNLVPLAAWTSRQDLGACQISDLARAEDGGLLMLMKGCMRIKHVSSLNPSETTFVMDESWAIPSEIPHPEGLQALGTDEFMIAADIKSIDTNLFWLKNPTN